MVATASPQPTRSPAGWTPDPKYGPLADSGGGDPAFYAEDFDDFVGGSLSVTGNWTVSESSGGSAALTAGDGGLGLLSTPATSSDYVSIQRSVAAWLLPQGTTYPTGTLGKKLFFLTRLQLSDVTNSAFVAGLVNTTSTIFTGGDITDGVYFSKASGGTVLNIITASGGTLSTWAIPTSAYSLANATNIDLSFYIDRQQNLNVFVGAQLFGYIPQSGSGSVSSVTGVSLLPVLGRCLQVIGPAYPFGPATGLQLGPWTVSSANLNLTLGIQAGAAAAKTLTVDFIGAMKER